MYVSYYHSSLLEFVSRFGSQNRNPKSTNVVESTDVIESTDVKSTDVESTDVVEFTSLQTCYGGCRVGREWFVSER